MDSIEFGKICRPLNIKYREIFGKSPNRGDYLCNQEEYLNALFFAIENKKPLSEILVKKTIDYNSNKKY